MRRRTSILATAIGSAVLVAPVLASSAPASPSSAVSGAVQSSADVREVTEGWEAGVRAGTTTFGRAEGARCQPQADGATPAQRRCRMSFSGRFVATDLGWHGRYAGAVVIDYINPGEDFASFGSGGHVTYWIRDASGASVGTLHAEIDSGTGGVVGYPGELDVRYSINERNEMVTLWLCGRGLNRLDGNLNPVRTYIDRLAYEGGGPC